MAARGAASTYMDTSLANARVRSAATASVIRATPAVSVVRYENTFKVVPESTFPYAATRDAIKDILTARLENQKYDASLVGAWSRELSETLRDKAKTLLNCRRYKVVSSVLIGEKGASTVAVASRCLWNDKYDSRAEVVFTNDSIYAIGLVFGVYYE